MLLSVNVDSILEGWLDVDDIKGLTRRWQRANTNILYYLRLSFYLYYR